MIITTEDIRNIRPIGSNVDDGRITTYINEAEKLDVLPAIGATEYRRLSEGTELTEDEVALLNGCYYTNYAGVTVYQAGIKTALCYLAYSRFIRNHSNNITPFGVVVKSTDESQPASQQTISAAAKDADKVGREYLSQAIAYWSSVSKEYKETNRKKRYIGIG